MTTTATIETYTATEAAARAGVTYRQLDYWARAGHLTPSVEADGSGTKRRYTTAEVDQAQILGRLHALGVRPGPATNISEYLDTLVAELLALSIESEAVHDEAHRRTP